ncbi:sulfite oxidase [Nocardioides sp. CER19]|uniref:sulfite oxidase n=1 Tax=Nocardioides sp. CER19 TaxID=3038538 RepID=UPI00244D02A4|nr:sulfite oxidase [Nocardioides sp. CER19]MDH2416825.1 sulfite oxidase [Nocardioides sp. CER19]
MTRVTRRTVFGLAASAAAAASLPSFVPPASAGAPQILKPLPPRWFVDYGSNAEMRWESVDPSAYLTPQRRLFVRNHTSTPTIDPSTYRLRVHGDGVRRDASLSLRELRGFRHVQATTVHECTGNGRSFFASQQGRAASGTQWTLGAVGTVRWTGVRLADVLRALGLRPDAVSVQATGLDADYVNAGVDYGPVRRPFPVAKALDDAILAWGADGKPLLPDHGFPLRLVLPGWVGIANIKWLGSLEVSTSELTSPWSTTWYNIDGPLSTNPVRSAWELPWGAQLARAPRIELTGRSWSGAGPIAGVEVSTDGGATWRPARLHAPGRASAGHGWGWTQWSTVLERPEPGARTLLARATDVRGRTQPDEAAWNPNGYFFDAVVRHPVTIL